MLQQRVTTLGPDGKIPVEATPIPHGTPSAVSAGDGMVPVSTSSGTWDYVPAGDFGSSGGASLGVTSHAPGTVATYQATTTAPTDLDASLLAVAFTAPASGRVQVDLSAVVAGSDAGTRTFWCLRSGTTTVEGSLAHVHTGTVAARATSSVLVSGLTPGDNYQWKWAAAASTGTTTLHAGGSAVDGTTAGPASMTVREAPFG